MIVAELQKLPASPRAPPAFHCPNKGKGMQPCILLQKDANDASNREKKISKKMANVMDMGNRPRAATIGRSLGWKNFLTEKKKSRGQIRFVVRECGRKTSL